MAIKTVQGKNFTMPDGVTTKGISQYDYFIKYGSKVKLLGLLKHTGRIFDAFTLVDATFIGMEPSRSKSLAIPTPYFGITLGIAVLGMVADMEFSKLDQALEAHRREELEKAKRKGLAAVSTLVNG